MKLTQERLREVLDYNPETGEFRRRVSNNPRFKVGSLAGGVSCHGYLKIELFGVKYPASRLVWLYVYGYFPENVVDHIDRDRSNDKLSNLREVSRSCNVRNSNGRVDSSSGVKGVTLKQGAWAAYIFLNRETVWLGNFSSKTLAAKCRYEAEVENGFIDCDSLSEAKSYLDNNPVTPEILEVEKGYREKVDLGIGRDNSSGVVGVSYHAKNKKWVASIVCDGEKSYLGIYPTKLEAAKARYAAELKYAMSTVSSAKKFIEEQENG